MGEPSSVWPRIRLVAGFAALPPAMALVTFLGYLAIGPEGRKVLAGGATVTEPVTVAAQLAFFVAIIGLALTLGGAVPSVLWLQARRQLSLSRLLLLGALIANVPFALIVLVAIVAAAADGTLSLEVTRLWYGTAGACRFVVIGAVHGLVAATVFWVVAVRGDESG